MAQGLCMWQDVGRSVGWLGVSARHGLASPLSAHRAAHATLQLQNRSKLFVWFSSLGGHGIANLDLALRQLAQVQHVAGSHDAVLRTHSSNRHMFNQRTAGTGQGINGAALQVSTTAVQWRLAAADSQTHLHRPGARGSCDGAGVGALAAALRIEGGVLCVWWGQRGK